jgi:hypothetical protein
MLLLAARRLPPISVIRLAGPYRYRKMLKALRDP